MTRHERIGAIVVLVLLAVAIAVRLLWVSAGSQPGRVTVDVQQGYKAAVVAPANAKADSAGSKTRRGKKRKESATKHSKKKKKAQEKSRKEVAGERKLAPVPMF